MMETCKHGKTAKQECSECHGGFDGASPMIQQETEMQGRARKFMWKDENKVRFGEYGNRLPLHPDEISHAMAEFAREELLSAAREIEPDLRMVTNDNSDITHAYKVGFADALRAVERRAKQ